MHLDRLSFTADETATENLPFALKVKFSNTGDVVVHGFCFKTQSVVCLRYPVNVMHHLLINRHEFGKTVHFISKVHTGRAHCEINGL